MQNVDADCKGWVRITIHDTNLLCIDYDTVQKCMVNEVRKCPEGTKILTWRYC